MKGLNWNRWSAWLCLCGLVTFIPAVFVPAMLVANAIDGPRWYSVWTGVRDFYRGGHTFLAGLIFGFSLVFPLVKFSLCLLCAAGRNFMNPGVRRGIVKVTGWTAKYSMLDVMVIAMLVMLVKVNEYVRVLPSLGLYLFSAAILFSALAGGALQRALAVEAREAENGPENPGAETSAPSRRGWAAWAAAFLIGAGLAWHGAEILGADGGGTVETVTVSRLTHRGQLRRSVEKTLALKELAKSEHDFFSKDTVRRLLEFGQAVTTDAGWKEPEARVALELKDGQTVTSDTISPVNLDEPALRIDFTLARPVPRREIAAVKLISNVEYLRVLDAPIEEEHVTAASDPFRAWTRTWHGRIFSFDLRGAESGPLRRGALFCAAGGALALWALAALLTPEGRRRAAPKNAGNK